MQGEQQSDQQELGEVIFEEEEEAVGEEMMMGSDIKTEPETVEQGFVRFYLYLLKYNVYWHICMLITFDK